MIIFILLTYASLSLSLPSVQQQLMKDLQERFNGISKELDRERSSVKELHSQLHSSTEKQSEYIAENLHLQEKLKQVCAAIHVHIIKVHVCFHFMSCICTYTFKNL